VNNLNDKGIQLWYKSELYVKVYYIDDYSVKIYYFRGSYKNRKYYKFKPTRGEIGNIHKLIQANQDDPLLYKDYLQVNK